MRLPTDREPIHPGEILLEEFIKPYGITQTMLASRIGVSRKHISEIVHCRKPITDDMAIRLSKFFGVSPEFWLNGQIAWNLWHLRHSKKAIEFRKIKPIQQYAVVNQKMDKDLFEKLTGSIEEAVEISKENKKPSRVFKYDAMDVKKIRNHNYKVAKNVAIEEKKET